MAGCRGLGPSFGFRFRAAFSGLTPRILQGFGRDRVYRLPVGGPSKSFWVLPTNTLLIKP